jgi:hypothetical protein
VSVAQLSDWTVHLTGRYTQGFGPSIYLTATICVEGVTTAEAIVKATRRATRSFLDVEWHFDSVEEA